MTINRYNYQEFFLLYTDNELKVAERKAVENFVKENPDLKQELTMLQDAVVKPDMQLVFTSKEALLKPGKQQTVIDADNFAEFAVAYTDNELNDAHRACLEAFIRDNPGFRKELDLFQSLTLTADSSITFPGKERLYHHEKERKPFILAWGRMAAAAIVLVVAGLFWLNNQPASSGSVDVVSKSNPSPVVAKEITPENLSKQENNSQNRQPAGVNPVNARQPVPVEIADNRTSPRHKKESRKAGTPAISDRKAGNQYLAAVTRPKIKDVVTKRREKDPVSAVAKVEDKAAKETEISGKDLAYLNPPEKNQTLVPKKQSLNINAVKESEYADSETVALTETDENVFLANIPLNKNNSLRGIIRKASRFIDKNTQVKNFKKSGLQIGNIEIAFQ